jgi:hypothetical protein
MSGTHQRRPRSYWQSFVCDTERSKDAIKSWFAPLSDGMVPYKAEILCDIETDAEKKLRAFMVDGGGHRFVFTRSCGARQVVVGMKRIAESAITSRALRLENEREEQEASCTTP